MNSPMTVSLVGRTTTGSSSCLPPPWVTTASSGEKPSTCCGLALEVALRDEQREVRVLRAGRLDPGVHLGLHALPDGVRRRPDHHRAAHRAVVGQLGLGDHVLVPAGKVLRPGSEHTGHERDILGDPARTRAAQSARSATHRPARRTVERDGRSADDPAAQDDPLRADHAQVPARILVVDDQSASPPSTRPGEPQPLPRAARSRRAARPTRTSRPRAAAASPARPGRARCRRPRRCPRRSAPRLVRRGRPRRGSRSRSARMCSAYPGNFSSARAAMSPNVSILIIVGTSAVPAPGHLVDQVGGQAGAVLDAVDAGPHQRRHARLLEACARRSARPAACAAATAAASVAGVPGRREVADGRGRSSRRPASPSRCRRAACSGHLGGDLLRAGTSTPMSRRYRRGGATCRPARASRGMSGSSSSSRVRERRARVPDRQHAGVPVDQRQLARLLEALDRRAAGRDADVAVRVDQARQDEPAVGDGLPRPAPASGSPGRRPATGPGPRRRAAPPRAHAAPSHSAPAPCNAARAARPTAPPAPAGLPRPRYVGPARCDGAGVTGRTRVAEQTGDPGASATPCAPRRRPHVDPVDAALHRCGRCGRRDRRAASAARTAPVS